MFKKMKIKKRKKNKAIQIFEYKRQIFILKFAYKKTKKKTIQFQTSYFHSDPHNHICLEHFQIHRDFLHETFELDLALVLIQFDKRIDKHHHYMVAPLVARMEHHQNCNDRHRYNELTIEVINICEKSNEFLSIRTTMISKKKSKQNKTNRQCFFQ